MERRYTELIKSSTAYATLMRDVKTDALSHAYLLTGEDSVSLDLLCDMFLAAAVGARYENGVYNRTLADIIYLPEDSEKVLVKDVNFLTETAFVTPTELTKKFYIIDRGETMNEASQNKLLKTLEEPPAVTVVVIKAANETKILPTVLSRCRKVELSPFPSADLKNLRNTIPTTSACISRSKRAAAESNGRRKYLLSPYIPNFSRLRSILC